MDSSNVLNVFPGEISDTRPSFLPRSHLRCRPTLSAPWQQAKGNEDLRGAGAICNRHVRHVFFASRCAFSTFLLKIDVFQCPSSLPWTHNMLFIFLVVLLNQAILCFCAWIRPFIQLVHLVYESASFDRQRSWHAHLDMAACLYEEWQS